MKGPGGIWIARSDGQNRHQLTHDGGYEPSWSPDGRKIIYNVDTGRFGIANKFFTVNAGGGRPRAFPMPHWSFDQYFSDPEWSPDGTTIAFSAEADGGGFEGIFVVGTSGENRREIIPGGFSPAWSPDGRKILYIVDRYTAFEVTYYLSTATADGKNKRPVTLHISGKHPSPREPAWSPDGHKIVFNDSWEREIWLADLTTGIARRIVRRPSASSPSWRPH